MAAQPDFLPAGLPTPGAWYGESVMAAEERVCLVLSPSPLPPERFDAGSPFDVLVDLVGGSREARTLGRVAPELPTITMIENGVVREAEVLWQEDARMRDTYDEDWLEFTTRLYAIRGCDGPGFGLRGADVVIARPDPSTFTALPAATTRAIERAYAGCRARGTAIPGFGTFAACTGDADYVVDVLVPTRGPAHGYVKVEAIARFGTRWYVAYEMLDGAAMQPL